MLYDDVVVVVGKLDVDELVLVEELIGAVPKANVLFFVRFCRYVY